MLNIRRRMSLPIELRSTRWSRPTTCSSRRLFFAWAFGFWLVSSSVGLSWKRSGPREAAFALGVCGSATIYVLSFYALGVASDFRYGYWAVLAAIAGSVVAASGEGRGAEPPR